MHQNKPLKAGPYANPVIYRKLSQLERGLEAQKNQMAFQGHLVVILHVHQPGIGMGVEVGWVVCEWRSGSDRWWFQSHLGRA